MAQSCWSPGSLSLSFGTVTGAGVTASSSGPLATCQSGAFTTYFRMCFYLGAGNQSSGSISPRRMIHHPTSTRMDYYLYSDAARTQLLGPVGGGYPTYTLDAVASGSNTQVTTPLTVYGRVPSGQTLAAGHYQEENQEGTVYYRYGTSGYPTSCTTGGSGGGTFTTSSSGINANYVDTCAISTATDLDFGSVTSLASARDQVSTITLRCPTGTAWKLGLDNGAHASGSTRRMTDGSGRYIHYELYRDGARSQRWGNTPGTDSSDGTGSGTSQTATVYGRVPAQAVSAAGSYADTVTVTLTF
ncbi:Csu type fimbrial protein [Luteimonas marina]|nr:spore coat protein U domain-containing protein [Luteimonas marina]